MKNDMLQGCKLEPHQAEGYSPDKDGDYSLGAWMGPPPTQHQRRQVCDKCVKKIQKGDDPVLINYEYDPNTKEVRLRIN